MDTSQSQGRLGNQLQVEKERENIYILYRFLVLGEEHNIGDATLCVNRLMLSMISSHLKSYNVSQNYSLVKNTIKQKL